MNMKTFYFDTGVVPYGHIPPIVLSEGEVWRGGTKQIPFQCEDVPDDAIFQFACSNPSLNESKYLLVRKIHNSALVSEYAYFQVPRVD
jgi:hypothetical protein